MCDISVIPKPYPFLIGMSLAENKLNRLGAGEDEVYRMPSKTGHSVCLRQYFRGLAQLPNLCLAACIMLALAGEKAIAQQDSDGSGGRPVVVYAGRIAGDENSTRVYFDMDRKIEVNSFIMEGPDRVIIDSSSMLFRFSDPKALEPRGLVSELRYGAIAKERSRVVLTLAYPARIAGMRVLPLEASGNHRLVLDLSRTSPAIFAANAAKQRELLGSSGDVATKGDRIRKAPNEKGRFTVVIDPGHGGIDGGAKGKDGLQEKDLVLTIATKLAEEVEGRGPYDVKLTREEDVFLSLRERVDFAQRHHAHLVISIHADSLRQKWVRGASVYTLSKKASDDLAHQLAESENMADIVAGLESPEQVDLVSDILADLTARETSVFSRSFSATLVDRFDGKVEMIKNPQRSASFSVLKAPEIPGVLVELGYLSNADDERQMSDPGWQVQITRLMAEAVDKFFDSRKARLAD